MIYLHLGRPEEAKREFLQAIELERNWAASHHFLGVVLQDEGRLGDAAAAYAQAVELGDASAEPKRLLCERFSALRQRLPAVVQGSDRPVDALESIEFGWLCAQPFERRYSRAAGLFAAAFGAEPKLAEAPHRYQAACAAARAGCGLGEEAVTLDEKEKVRLRQQALAWLQADLDVSKQAASNRRQNPAPVLGALRRWQQDKALDSVRNPQALAKLPQTEREAWQKLWTDVESVAGPATVVR